MIAVLFCDPRGSYADAEGVEMWDEMRDARLYDGPHPVVAHPPCSRWCSIAWMNQKRYGQKVGDDGGCFESALASVRRWGGVLEHPAKSIAWKTFDLPRPSPHGGWSGPDGYGGRTSHVEQAQYGHRCRKATWLYAVGVDFPDLRWGAAPDELVTHTVGWCGNRSDRSMARPRLSKRKASETPTEFRDALLAMALTASSR